MYYVKFYYAKCLVRRYSKGIIMKVCKNSSCRYFNWAWNFPLGAWLDTLQWLSGLLELSKTVPCGGHALVTNSQAMLLIDWLQSERPSCEPIRLRDGRVTSTKTQQNIVWALSFISAAVQYRPSSFISLAKLCSNRLLSGVSPAL